MQSVPFQMTGWYLTVE